MCQTGSRKCAADGNWHWSATLPQRWMSFLRFIL